MSDRERIVQLLDKVPDYKIGYILAYIQGITADEEADDAFCQKMVQNYLDEPERESVSFEQAVRECGLTIDEIQN